MRLRAMLLLRSCAWMWQGLGDADGHFVCRCKCGWAIHPAGRSCIVGQSVCLGSAGGVPFVSMICQWAKNLPNMPDGLSFAIRGHGGRFCSAGGRGLARLGGKVALSGGFRAMSVDSHALPRSARSRVGGSCVYGAHGWRPWSRGAALRSRANEKSRTLGKVRPCI